MVEISYRNESIGAGPMAEQVERARFTIKLGAVESIEVDQRLEAIDPSEGKRTRRWRLSQANLGPQSCDSKQCGDYEDAARDNRRSETVFWPAYQDLSSGVALSPAPAIVRPR